MSTSFWTASNHNPCHPCLFALQESKYRDAIRYYQPLIARNANNLLGVTAIVLANLCVSYIMTSQVSHRPYG
jgi:hypothetical protein